MKMFIEINDTVYKNLGIIADLRGIGVEDIIFELLNREINKYGKDGEINLVKVKFWTNMLECSVSPDVVKDMADAYVFCKTEIYGRTYYRLIYNGQMIAAPYEAVEFYNEDDRHKVR